MSTVLNSVSGKSWYTNVPFVLPILLISGKMDPVGAYGKGILQVCQDLKASGHKNVTMKLYDADRHEILNELDKEKVYSDVVAWTDKVISNK